MAKKWKYAKPHKKVDFEEYLQLPDGEKHSVVLKNWQFNEEMVDGEKVYKFRCDVTMNDGEATDKILVIKHYEAIQKLKKMTAKKVSIKATLPITIVRKYNTELYENTFMIEAIKEED